MLMEEGTVKKIFRSATNDSGTFDRTNDFELGFITRVKASGQLCYTVMDSYPPYAFNIGDSDRFNGSARDLLVSSTSKEGSFPTEDSCYVCLIVSDS